MYYPTFPNTGYNFNNPMLQQQTPMPAAGQQGQVIRVHGREGANTLANTLGPNRSALVVDETSEDIIFCIATDGAGFATVKALKFTAVPDETAKPVAKENDYVSKADFNELSSRFDSLKSEIEKLMENVGNGKSDY